MSAIHSYDLRPALAHSWTSTSNTAWQVDGSITAIDSEIEEVEGDRLPANSSTLDDLIDDCEDNSLQVSQGQDNVIEAFTEGLRPTTTPVFIGCDDGLNAVAGEVKTELEHDVEPEQIVIKIEPGLDELADADGLTATNNYDPEHERICLDDVFEEKFNPATSNCDEFRNINLTAGSTSSSSSSSNLTNVDSDFAARIKLAFGSLSSRHELGLDEPYDVDDKDLAVRIKQEFGTLSSSFLETPPPPRSRIKLGDDRSVVVDQKERCLTELSKLFPTIDCMEILDVLVRHQWALGASIRYLRSTLQSTQNLTPIRSECGAGAEPVRHVISSFSIDHKREAAHKIAIKEKESCLHQLCEQFPMTDFLELQNVLVAHRWSVKAAVDYLEARAISVKNSHLPRCQKVVESDVVIEEEDPNDDLPTDLADKIKRAFTSLSSGLNLALKAESRKSDEETDKRTQGIKHKRLKKLADSKNKLGASNDEKPKSLIGKKNCSKKANGLPKRKAAIAATNKLALFDFEDNVAESHKHWEQKKKWRARKLRRERRARFASMQTG